MSIVSPLGYSSSTCGYCGQGGGGTRSKEKSSKSYGIWAHRLSPEHYQRLIDTGWRRSGDYIYKPDNDRTCCPQVPIRLDAGSFRASKSHKRALTNLLFYVRTLQKPAKWKGRWSRERDSSLQQRWDEIEHGGAWADKVAGPSSRKLEVHLCLASSSDEKYQLYRKYQGQVHKQSEDDIGSLQSFQRFLVNNSFALTMPSTGQVLDERQEAYWKQRRFRVNSLPSELPYGCYHQEYRLDGRLIAVGVLDLLPKCVSSVYVFYDPDVSEWQLGKISALQEIALVHRLSAIEAMKGIRYYYMGFYIASCQKMRYKAEYRPSELLNTHTNTWHRDHTAVSRTSAPLPHNDDDDGRIPTDPRPPPGILDPARLFSVIDNRANPQVDTREFELLTDAIVLEAKLQHQGCKPLLASTPAQEYIRGKSSSVFAQALDGIAALAETQLLEEMVFFL